MALMGGSLCGILKALAAEGVWTPTGKKVWSTTIIRNFISDGVYKPHTHKEVAELVAPEVLARLDPERCYGIWWFNRRKTVTTQTSVLFFYPKDDTPGCTKEACAFRDDYEEFGKLDAEVVGISSDSVESHRSFARKHRLPFTLLSDEGGKVRKLYGVSNTLGLFPGRVTYVIDEQGVIKHVFSSQLGTKRHVEEALKILTSIG